MRWLVLILLCGNAVYLGWELQQQSRAELRNAAATRPVSPSAERLQLLGELPAPPEPRLEPAPTPGEADPSYTADNAGGPVAAGDEINPGLVASMPDLDVALPATAGDYSCFSFGPLLDEQQSLWLLDWFSERQVEVSNREEPEARSRLFWVYLAPSGDVDQAARTMDSLQSRGIKDYRLIEKGSLQNAVSLGLFSSQAAVNERLQELEQQGFQPVVVPYTDARRLFWVDVRVPSASGTLEQMFGELPGRYQSVPIQCAEIASAAPDQ